MPESIIPKPETGTAAELLGDWRAAGRDLAAAQETASVAMLAATAADVAKEAAVETGDAARMSAEAALRAEVSARKTAEAADITAKAARGERREADDAVERSATAEVEAGERFREAQNQGFPKR